MRTRLAALFLALLLPSCTMLDANKGTYFTNADNTKVKMNFSGGKITHYEAETNLHSPIVRAHWHGLTNLGAEAVAFGAGGPGAGAGVGAVTAFLNRPTTRVPATPAPAKP